jgi:hypothetical protein
VDVAGKFGSWRGCAVAAQRTQNPYTVKGLRVPCVFSGSDGGRSDCLGAVAGAGNRGAPRGARAQTAT